MAVRMPLMWSGQKEIQQVKREAAQDMKEIRAKWGRSSKYANQKKAELYPYERLTLAIDDMLVQLDGTKLELRTWIDEHK